MHTRKRQGRAGGYLQPSQLITHRLSKLRPSYAACSRRHTVLAKRWWGLQKAGNLTSTCAAAVAVALRVRPGGRSGHYKPGECGQAGVRLATAAHLPAESELTALFIASCYMNYGTGLAPAPTWCNLQPTHCHAVNNPLQPCEKCSFKRLHMVFTQAGVGRFVLLSSLLTNARAAGQEENPNYKFLNLFGGVLDHKLVAEQYLRVSGARQAHLPHRGLEFCAVTMNARQREVCAATTS